MVVVLLALACGPAWAASANVTQKVRATGVAVSEPGDEAAACQSARRHALRQAVEEGVGVLVTSTTKVSRFAVIDDRILSATRGFVRSYDVVAEQPGDDGSCQVTVDALVDMGQLHQELAALELAAVGAGLPRVLCRAEERLAGQVVAWGIVGARLQELVAGMTDLLEVAVAPTTSSNPDSEGPDTEGLQADILVQATAAVTPTTPRVPMGGRRVSDSGLFTASATLQVRLGWVDEQAPIGILHGVGRGAGASPRAAAERALQHAVSEVADSLRAVLAEDLRQRAFSTRTTELLVEGLGTVPDLDQLVRSLELALGPVQSLVARTVTAELASFQVQSTSSAFELARQLSARGLPSAAVEIRRVTANRLRVALHAVPALETP